MVQLVPRGVARVMKRHPYLYLLGRKARFVVGSAFGARPITGIAGRVHYNDFMLEGLSGRNVEHYNRYAISFIDRLEKELETSGRSWSDVGACLEIGCGYGRVVRYLAERLPPHRIYVSDILDEAARFCAQEFAVQRIGVVGMEEFPPQMRFDVVYLLSVFTHIRIEQMAEICRQVIDRLAPHGILAFTTQGRGVAENEAHLRSLGDSMISEKRAILKALDTTGYYYKRYEHYLEDYGISLHSREYIEQFFSDKFPTLKRIHYGERENFYQDVFVYKKQDDLGAQIR
jgi:SAM-dependent methyltransferase